MGMRGCPGMRRCMVKKRVINMYIRFIIVLLVSFFVCNCEPYGLYLSDTCLPVEVDAIEEGIERLNDMFGYDRVELLGVINSKGDPLNDGVDTVMCWHGRTRGARWGEYGYDLYLFVDTIKIMCRADYDDCLLWIVMHELGHYVGGDHLPSGNVMYEKQTYPLVLNYTEEDRKELVGDDD